MILQVAGGTRGDGWKVDHVLVILRMEVAEESGEGDMETSPSLVGG